MTKLLLVLLVIAPNLCRDQLLEEMMREPLGPRLPLAQEMMRDIFLFLEVMMLLLEEMLQVGPLGPSLLLLLLGVDRLRHGEVGRADLLVLDGTLLLLHLPTLGPGRAGLEQEMYAPS